MSRHISTIKIESFRGIKNLYIEGLAPINIITGDNNSGKTSALEIIETLDAPANPSMWRSLIRRDRFMPALTGLSLYEGFLSLFNIDGQKRNVRYEITFSDGETVKIEVNGEVVEESIPINEWQELSGIYPSREEIDEKEDGLTEDVNKLIWTVDLNGQRILDNSIYDMQRAMKKGMGQGADHLDENIHLADVRYISPVRHAEGTVYLNSVLDSPELYEQMLQILREFDPGIISINVDNSDEKYRRGNVYKILSKEHNSALPLNVYGDGMKKAVLLMSAVVKTQGGILLLDEFETAIHTSAMDKTFKWILETCMKLNVQLFLTTHSEEAIDKVLKCSPELQNKINVYTLYKKDDETVARRLDARKAIEIKDEMGIELR